MTAAALCGPSATTENELLCGEGAPVTVSECLAPASSIEGPRCRTMAYGVAPAS